ncbi:Radical SAM [Raphidiopsis brookii D9]|nr:Radical SAM [Raphidiopsis brookii D9]
MTLEQAEKILLSLKGQGVCEILILSGEVHSSSSRRQEWLELIYDLCLLALSMGFLPHTNAGILSFSEMQKLKSVNASMGLMLEQLTPKLLHTVHRHAPSKIPELRLQHLQWAGELQIPFTTGLLLGIGENEDDRRQTLMAIADLHLKYQNIQEVILQPHSPGSQQTFDEVAFDPYQLPGVIAQAREILPSDITIQIPPNLVPEENWLLACLDAGARDLGGIGPKDEVNPDYPHREVNRLREVLLSGGWTLLPRLPVYQKNWYKTPLGAPLTELTK